MKKTTLTRVFILLFCFKMFAQVATPKELVAKMGRGINLGNTLDAPTEGQWRTPVNINTYFKDIKAAGFKHVRIPVRWDGYLTPSYTSTETDVTKYIIKDTYLQRVISVVDAALLEGLVVVMDAHHEHWFTGTFNAKETAYYVDPIANPTLLAARKARFKAIWTIIADRFKAKSDDLIFELMNEPYFDMNKAQVDEMNETLLKIVRTNNPTRKVIITGGSENNHLSPQQIDPAIFADKNLIATFHYYDPYKFTASSEELYTQETWGTATEKSTVDAHFDSLKTWAAKYNVPVFLGEYACDNEKGYKYNKGEYSAFGGPEAASRDEWHRYITNAAMTRGFAPCFWDAGSNANKTLYLENSRTWDNNTLEIVLGVDYLLKGFKDFDFNTDNSGFTANNASISNTNGNLRMLVSGSAPYITNTAAAINADKFHYLEVTLKNTTSNGYMRFSIPTATGGRSYINKVITTNDTGYKTYKFDLGTLVGWSGNMEDIRIHFKKDATTNAVKSTTLPILIDKLSFTDGVVPPVYKHSYTFDLDNDNWEGKYATAQGNNGLLNVQLTNTDQGGISLTNTVVDSALNSWIHITVKNQTNLNNIMKVVVGANSGFTPITTNDTDFTTYHMCLGKMDSWIKDISELDVLFYNKDTGLSDANGSMLIDSIIFDGLSPGIANVGNFEFNVDGDIQGWSALGVTKETIKNGILTITPNTNTPKLSHLSAGISAANKYLVLTARNNSSDTGLKISYLNGSTTTNPTTGATVYGRTYITSTMIAKDVNFTKYIVNCTGTGWANTINDFQILFGANSISAQDGSIEIESIQFVADPYGVKNDFDFTKEGFGWKANSYEATTTQTTEGVKLDLNKNNQYPKFLSFNYSVSAEKEKLVKITFNNNSTCNKVQLKLPDGSFSPKLSIVSGVQTIEFDVEKSVSWTGVLAPSKFSFQFTQDAVIPTGQIVISNVAIVDKTTAAAEIIRSKDNSGIEVIDGIMTVKLNDLEMIYLFDVSGKKIAESKLKAVDITNYPKGIYFVLSRLTDGTFISNKIVF